MPQNEYIERFTKQYGKRLDHDERKRKREARESHKSSERAQNYRGLRAKLYAEGRRKEKIQMKKAIRAKEEKNVKSAAPDADKGVPQPEYLLDRSQGQNAKALSSQIKQKRAEKAAKFSVPLPRVRGISESEVFSVVKTGRKTSKKAWKRMYVVLDTVAG
jgi:ribosome biogenesis protein NSA2